MKKVNSEMLINAAQNGTVYLGREIKYTQDTILYYCCRNIMSKKKDATTLYMDLILYEKFNLEEKVCPRSLGHRNDIMELEVFQILYGCILSIFISPDNNYYYGIFNSNEFYCVPKGWFHCTYCLAPNTIVANFYGNTFWNDNIEIKPYFQNINDFHVYIKENVGFIAEMRKYNSKIIFNKESNEKLFERIGLLNYEVMPGQYMDMFYSTDNIFDMFYAF